MELNSVKTTLAKFLVRFGVSADLLTVGGLFLSLGAGALMLQGSFFTAGVTLLFSGLLDMLDGEVARVSDSESTFGGILDSSLDRYGDGAVLGAAVLYYGQLGERALSILAVVALIGSFAISYVRARAECEVEDCRVGFWERGERLVLIALALLMHNLPAAVILLALGTHWTVFQRLAFANHQTGSQSSKDIPFYLRASSRNSWPYYLKVFLAVLALFLVRA
jgi:CDP-diacylglycerol--glycerol-3-phosphate 3-phosphatidyltransferase